MKIKCHFLPIIIPVLAGLLFMALCCLNLNSAVWFDESYTHYLIRGDFADIWHLTSLDVHPPLYYFALKTWSLIFGDSVLTLRFMSIFFGFIAIIFAFHLVKRLFNSKTATISTFLMAISPMFIRYGQEMRMYTMVLAIVFAATYFLSLALEKQVSAPKSALKFWLIYAVLICLGMWTQYFSAFAWLAHLAYILYYFGILRRGGLKTLKKLWQNKVFFRNLLLTYGVAVLLFLPWFSSFLAQSNAVQGGFWISAVSLSTVAGFFSESLVFTDSTTAQNWLVPLLLVAVLSVIFCAVRVLSHSTEAERKKYLLFFFLLFLPLILIVLLSLPPLRPVFMPRYILYSAVTLWLLIGLILAAYPKEFSPRLTTANLPLFIAILSTLACSIVGILNVTNRAPDSEVLSTLEPAQYFSSETEPILVASDWNFYDAVPYSTATSPVYFYDGWLTHDWGSMEPLKTYRYNVLDNLDDFLANHPKFWLLLDNGEELPEELSGYFIQNTIENPKHSAYELYKL